MSGGCIGDTQSWWVDEAGAEQGARGCRVVTRTLALGLNPGSCGSLAALAAWEKQVGDFVFSCKPLTQPGRRLEKGDARPGRTGLRPPQLGYRGRAPISSLGPGSTSAWAPAPHSFLEALTRGLPVDRPALHSFPGWDAEDAECHETGSSGGGERRSPAGRAAACARSCPRGHIWAWALFRCALT